MRISTGVDLVAIARIGKSLQNPRFAGRVYGERELAQYGGKMPCASMAAAYGAKEAFAKAAGTGIRGFSLKEVELLHKADGKPYLAFSGKAEKIVRDSGFTFDVSISHEKEMAIAFVVAYRA